jgi:hypothetical protein
MKTLLVTGREAVPERLRAIVTRGSTSVDEVTSDDLTTFISQQSFGVDRLVFWTGHGDPDVRTLARNYAEAAGADRPQTIVFVTALEGDRGVSDMAPHEIFVWPRDEEKLTMAFMTGG